MVDGTPKLSRLDRIIAERKANREAQRPKGEPHEPIRLPVFDHCSRAVGNPGAGAEMMNWLSIAIDSARELNPKVHCRPIGEDQIGKHFTLVLPDGRQTSIVLKTGDSLARKIDETLEKFK
jgi:hypothetical protein